ncbi:peptidyl-prolyl cis-trans isomerase FKBP13, chloroplastic [Selaginella moellendorffii]|uniref:peptidyl-prolyl cis-trans isomerase FKBP13, chloroplastic n=1 Tax=Selaginella moellendorffii TaxID=88036 RepID=UPI000D1C2AE0|nr:peptidyl-prolyl cis-trans isomerase FKBP13, chloroplastic [Selaginella moellendorffii]|eukprot:XP_024516674.1 peptidyl-prolyl cis-trans isomerase FKBP13, chloroplastic [Selaginella moellendorffii]
MAILQPNPSPLLQMLRPARSSTIAVGNANANPPMQQHQQQQQQHETMRLVMGRREASMVALTSLLLSGGVRLAAAAEEEAPLQQLQETQQVEELQPQPQAQECEWKVMESGLSFCDLVVGTGTAPVKGNVIRLHYQGRREDGFVFDSSYNRGEPFSFQLNSAGVMKGIYEAILGSGDEFPPMRPGGKRKVRVPPELGFGKNPGMCPRFWSGPCTVPANSVLLYDLEYLGLWKFEDDTRPFHLFT